MTGVGARQGRRLSLDALRVTNRLKLSLTVSLNRNLVATSMRQNYSECGSKEEYCVPGDADERTLGCGHIGWPRVAILEISIWHLKCNKTFYYNINLSFIYNQSRVGSVS